MNGLNTTNFVLGMALAKDLPRNEAATAGLAASQFPAGNILGAVLLKPMIDARTEAEARAKRAEDRLAAIAAGTKEGTGGSGSEDVKKFFEEFLGTTPGASGATPGGFGRSGSILSSSPLFGGGPLGGGGPPLTASFFGTSSGGDGAVKDLQNKLQDKQNELDDQRRRFERELKLANEATVNQIDDLRRAYRKEVDAKIVELEDKALAAAKALHAEETAVAAFKADLEAREAKLREAEAALKPGGKYSR